MLIKRLPGWHIKDDALTPEALVLDRRGLLKSAGRIGVAFAAASMPLAGVAAQEVDPSAKLYPFRHNDRYGLGDREITSESTAGNYNNFYEFGQSKKIASAAQALKTRPWMIRIDGLVEKPFEIGIDELLKAMPREERSYRHRCVEAWSMAVNWSGFPLKALLDYAKPLGSAKYIQMQTFLDPEIAPGQKRKWYPWPYTEGLTMAEAASELAFMATGVYGKPLLKQFGAPLRLALPWKYGFKSIKSVNRITFQERRPTTYWEALQPNAYGFWANVNPDVPHPRWSQADEEVLGNWFRQPTTIFNGYGAYVAHLYKGLEHERLFV
ncbi:MAG: protein-methionine-sulfoxide reductase catalytic subunit MsrP [Beijerinckiaceae bacterium]|nr:protein-methionine-sulfoxide reductase catalytic subunit MsrP [Beijerinckiaceae bacterium]